MSITKYVQDATRLRLGHSNTGFNATLAALAGPYEINPVSIDWTVGGLQFFPAFLSPDELDDNTPYKYPMAFLHGVRSRNTHESLGRKFSGPVEMSLAIWVTTKITAAGKAAVALDLLCSAIEETLNGLFYDGNWPQQYGASNAVCLSLSCSRSQLQKAGEEYRQALILSMVFTLDTN